MVIKYFYECDKCGHTYAEQRTDSESQYFTVCASCGEGSYIETSQQVIEAIPEVVIPEVVIDEAASE